MSNKMWGGRFKAGPAEIMEEINPSIAFDKRLYAQDIAGSKAHCEMLAATGIISGQDAKDILQGLDTILSEIEEGRFDFRPELEDIHMNVEARLTELIGPAAGRLHTGRSRNDQVATDFKLWVRDQVDGLMAGLQALERALAKKALAHAGTIMPGFTHLQNAQPVTFGHHCLAYVEMFSRDHGRFADARRRLNECPLGAAALAGTSFPIDRQMTARALGFDRPTANSMDTVADRDFALEALAAATITGVHLSRLAEEIVMWCSAQFGFVTLSDALTTGSSIMPQKRNPDAAELVRGKVGRIAGALVSLTTMLKGLGLTFAKDMQEDKEPTFDALDTLGLCLAAMTAMVEDMEPDAERMRASAVLGFSTATDLADWLVRELALPFREAHHATGALVAAAEKKGCDLADLTLDEMQAVEARITDGVFDVLTVEKSVASRTSLGGTAPQNVRCEAERWLERLAAES